jgi:hypothetical protein
MNNRRVPDPLDDEQLSAYLLGDLSAADAAALERSLADDPDRAARLAVLADALVVLADADGAEPPDGFEQRLSQRLEAGAQIIDLSAQRRARRTQWLTGAAAVAVVVFGAVFASNMLGGSSDMAGTAEEAMPGPVIVDDELALADEAALQERYSDLPEVEALLGTDADAAPELAQQYTKAVPLTLDSLRVTSGASSYSAEDSDDTADAPAPVQGEAAPAPAEVDQDAAQDKSGIRPTRRERLEAVISAGGTAASDRDLSAQSAATPRSCLKAISADATQPLVPARIEALRYAGKRAIAYVLVTASPDSPRLDRTELWVVSRRNCSTLVFQQY